MKKLNLKQYTERLVEPKGDQPFSYAFYDTLIKNIANDINSSEIQTQMRKRNTLDSEHLEPIP